MRKTWGGYAKSGSWSPQGEGGNGYIINSGHRRVAQAIVAGLTEITVLVDEVAEPPVLLPALLLPELPEVEEPPLVLLLVLLVEWPQPR